MLFNTGFNIGWLIYFIQISASTVMLFKDFIFKIEKMSSHLDKKPLRVMKIEDQMQEDCETLEVKWETEPTSNIEKCWLIV